MTENKIESYKDLNVWKKSMTLVKEIYTVTSTFPSNEMHGLVSQMRRAAVSVPSNIAEGSRRSSKKDFKHFLFNAFGSGAELETQIEITKSLSFGKGIDWKTADILLHEVMKMLNVMTNKSDD